MKRKHFVLFFVIVTVSFLFSCASEGSSSSSSSSGSVVINPSDPSQEETQRYITFRFAVNGEISGNLYYAILLNAEAQPIQSDDIGTFTDVIRIYKPDSLSAPQYIWYHRISPSDRILSYIADLTNYVSYSDDMSMAIITFPLNNSSVVFDNYIQNTFTAQALVTDTSGAELGKFIDTIGPDLSVSSQYTITVSLTSGAVDVPSSYPNDMLNDCYDSNIPAGTPYENADIVMFDVNVYSY